MAGVNMAASSIGVQVLEAGSPESLSAVVNKWLDGHLSSEVVSIDFQAGSATGGPLYLMIVYKRERPARRA
jgi:hypothetical protein